jgi:hypothetical protein
MPSRRDFLSLAAAVPGAAALPYLGKEASQMTPPLKLLYRLTFTYPQGWGIPLAGDDSTEGQFFFIAEGRAEGRSSGRMTGANHPRRRGDGTFEPDFQGVIETDDGAVIYFNYRGYGRAYPPGRRQIVGSATHLSAAERYRWLNDVVAASTGEVRAREGQPAELIVDVYELEWQPIDEEG